MFLIGLSQFFNLNSIASNNKCNPPMHFLYFLVRWTIFRTHDYYLEFTANANMCASPTYFFFFLQRILKVFLLEHDSTRQQVQPSHAFLMFFLSVSLSYLLPELFPKEHPPREGSPVNESGTFFICFQFVIVPRLELCIYACRHWIELVWCKIFKQLMKITLLGVGG